MRTILKLLIEAISTPVGDGRYEYQGKVGVWRYVNGDRIFFPSDGSPPLAGHRTISRSVSYDGGVPDGERGGASGVDGDGVGIPVRLPPAAVIAPEDYESGVKVYKARWESLRPGYDINANEQAQFLSDAELLRLRDEADEDRRRGRGRGDMAGVYAGALALRRYLPRREDDAEVGKQRAVDEFQRVAGELDKPLEEMTTVGLAVHMNSVNAGALKNKKPAWMRRALEARAALVQRMTSFSVGRTGGRGEVIPDYGQGERETSRDPYVQRKIDAYHAKNSPDPLVRKRHPERGRWLKYYTGDGYEEINAPLRKGEVVDGWSPGEFDMVDELFRDANWGLKEDTVTYRGISQSHPLVGLLHRGELKLGTVVEDGAYQSTSLLGAIARGFSKSPRGVSITFGAVVMRVSVPKGPGAVYVGGSSKPSERVEDDVSDAPMEYEVLLDRGTAMRVVGVERRGSRTYVDVDVVRK